MRIRIKTGEFSKRFKLKSEKKEGIGIIWMQIGNMLAVRDCDNMEPNCDGEEFAIGCLGIVNRFFLPEGMTVITKQNMAEPSWNKWKDSCKREWHYAKTKHRILRSYYFESKGWLRLKIDNETPQEVFDKLGLQKHDRIAIQIESHNNTLNEDAKKLGRRPRGYLPAPD